MTAINLTGQDEAKTQIAPKLLQLKTQMDKRKDIWDKLPVAKKKAWIQSDKDPIMGIAWSIYKYLRTNFFGEETDEYL